MANLPIDINLPWKTESVPPVRVMLKNELDPRPQKIEGVMCYAVQFDRLVDGTYQTFEAHMPIQTWNDNVCEYDWEPQVDADGNPLPRPEWSKHNRYKLFGYRAYGPCVTRNPESPVAVIRPWSVERNDQWFSGVYYSLHASRGVKLISWNACAWLNNRIVSLQAWLNQNVDESAVLPIQRPQTEVSAEAVAGELAETQWVEDAKFLAQFK
jgi:hypothetical protein